MAETAAQKAEREKAGQTPQVSDGPSQNVLTEDMPQPPGVTDRRRRVSRKRRKGPFVKYVGAASRRSIAKSDWVQLNFQGDVPKNGYQEAVWDASNDYLIEVSAFTDEQLDYLLIDDMQAAGGHSFLEVDYDDDNNLVQVVDE